ncbi:hypothetical protein [Microbacterium sp. NPDC091662]|uniref:hypothetical protein n=1 Tax=Microbacterium sp. NPDC091662 TaxID=3364211 RepID=UPI00381C8EAA
MTLYLVRNDSGAPIWVAHNDNEQRIWSYMQNSHDFYLNRGLYRDFYFEQLNTYEMIDCQEAELRISEGIGLLEPTIFARLYANAAKEVEARTVDEIFDAERRSSCDGPGAPGPLD